MNHKKVHIFGSDFAKRWPIFKVIKLLAHALYRGRSKQMIIFPRSTFTVVIYFR